MRLFFKTTFSNFSESLKYTVMKRFKIFDLTLSILLIIASGVYALVEKETGFILSYFIVGGWQSISMIIHAYNRCFTYKSGSRYIYHWISLVSVVTMPLGSFWILIFTAPFMAIYYTWLCYHEVFVKMQRPIAVLK